MRKIIISAALLSAIAVAAPASAQYYDRDHNRGGGNISQQVDQIQQRIQRAAQRGLVSRGEANRLFRQADQIDRLHYRYARNGLNYAEQRDLRNRVQNLRQHVRFERQEGRYDNRYGRNDRYDRDGRYYR